MSTADLPNLLPLGGASVLMIYLLRVWVSERSRWMREREAMIEEHRVDNRLREEQCDKRLAYWKDRAIDAETRLDGMRKP